MPDGELPNQAGEPVRLAETASSSPWRGRASRYLGTEEGLFFCFCGVRGASDLLDKRTGRDEAARLRDAGQRFMDTVAG